LFFESVMKCSANIIEYELLKKETLKIAQISQKILNIAYQADLYERSKHRNEIDDKLNEINMNK
jgi:hypothetical protein